MAIFVDPLGPNHQSTESYTITSGLLPIPTGTVLNDAENEAITAAFLKRQVNDPTKSITTAQFGIQTPGDPPML